MSCEFNAGRDAVVQLGLATTWGTKADTTMKIPFTSEGLAYTPNYGEADAMIGNVLTSRLEILSEHVEGDIETYVTPDEIGLYLFAALGKQMEVVTNADSTYTHYFIPVKSGGSTCLPMLSAEVDRLKEVMTYNSLKVNSLGISASKEDYVMCSLSFVGDDENDVGALTAGINLSSKSYFKFRGAKVYADTGSGNVEMDEVSSIDFTWENNLDSSRYTSSGEGKLSEMNPQGRSASLSLTVYLSAVINTLRKTIFKLGATMSVDLEFTVEDIITGTVQYEFGIKLPCLYLTEVPYNIDSPDEPSFDLTFHVADFDDVDFVSDGDGLADTEIQTSAATMVSGDLVRAEDPDGFQRVFKYIGATVTPATGVITFATPATEASGEVEPIFDGTDVFNDTDWELADGVVAYLIDGSADLIEDDTVYA